MKKLISLILISILLMGLGGCCFRNAVLDEVMVYAVRSNIHSLDIEINAADFRIETGEDFLVKSNLKYLSVAQEDGVLTIKDESKGNSDYSEAMLTICVPEGTVFDSADIDIGAAKLWVEILSASSVELSVGAGEMRFEELNASSEIEIEGGAGEITVVGGVLNDLSLKVGTGSLDMTAVLLGNSDLEFGVGSSEIRLIGSKDDYKIDVKKGLGSITVDGEAVAGRGSIGNGRNHIEIKGGIGATELFFGED